MPPLVPAFLPATLRTPSGSPSAGVPLPAGMLPVFFTGSGSLLCQAGAAFGSFAVPTAVQGVKAVAAIWKRRLTESVFTYTNFRLHAQSCTRQSAGLPEPSLMTEPTLEAGASTARSGARSAWNLGWEAAKGCPRWWCCVQWWGRSFFFGLRLKRTVRSWVCSRWPCGLRRRLLLCHCLGSRGASRLGSGSSWASGDGWLGRSHSGAGLKRRRHSLRRGRRSCLRSWLHVGFLGHVSQNSGGVGGAATGGEICEADALAPA